MEIFKATIVIVLLVILTGMAFSLSNAQAPPAVTDKAPAIAPEKQLELAKLQREINLRAANVFKLKNDLVNDLEKAKKDYENMINRLQTECTVNVEKEAGLWTTANQTFEAQFNALKVAGWELSRNSLEYEKPVTKQAQKK